MYKFLKLLDNSFKVNLYEVTTLSKFLNEVINPKCIRLFKSLVAR